MQNLIFREIVFPNEPKMFYKKYVKISDTNKVRFEVGDFWDTPSLEKISFFKQ